MFNKIMQKIPPYQAEFIFRGLRKGWPNLHQNVRLSFKLRKYPPTKWNLFSVASGKGGQICTESYASI